MKDGTKVSGEPGAWSAEPVAWPAGEIFKERQRRSWDRAEMRRGMSARQAFPYAFEANEAEGAMQEESKGKTVRRSYAFPREDGGAVGLSCRGCTQGLKPEVIWTVYGVSELVP